ncbi:tRNA-splicing ligase [Sediminicola sp. YIK13]|uniref:RtcB family protein n=1 Tax=Sediminicola sp. YIK13 TaxID=1453352 RepID=UPI000720ED9C|nr:RtcB family protein [Sediminicola sp. YIK13]ALM06893.1 tRNA-splicing ligase [Sediminicola sp. YIK13]
MKIGKQHLNKIEDYLWEIPKSFHKNMLVPARVLAHEPILDDIIGDRSLVQLVNVASLPGIQGASWVMPDVHEGYGFPIGGVAATSHPDGAISPGGIGYDINCGVRLLTSIIMVEEVKDKIEALSKEMYAQIPSGMGKGGFLHLTQKELEDVLSQGAKWAVDKGYGKTKDLAFIENNGRLPDADPSKVSERAKSRGLDQLGTIGSGNHFVEVDFVDEIYEPDVAEAFGLKKGQLVVLIHTGSRGLGHQIATDHIKIMMTAMDKYGIQVPDRELTCVPFSSLEGQNYYKAMCAAANYAWANRQVITWEARKAWANIFGKDHGQLELMYDVAHNMAKLETHKVDGKPHPLIVHRKGATRAFGPGFSELPESYNLLGQPVIIPGSMGTSSYILIGTSKSHDLTFGSCCHGAGRRLSRTASKKQVNAPQLKEQLKERGIYVQAGSFKGIAEEAPIAYKDVNLVVETVSDAGIAKKVAKLRPVAVVKG